MENLENKYIIGIIEYELFGFDINKVTSVIEMKHITRVPGTKESILGVVNLRGVVIPVMSLRKRLEIPEMEDLSNAKIVIVKPTGQDEMGIVVDEVKKVADIRDISSRKIVSNDEFEKYISGIGKYNDTLISIINIDNIVEFQEDR